MAFNLPNEVLLLILDAPEGTQDSFRLLQVCRTWNLVLISKVNFSVSLASGIHCSTRLQSAIRECILPWGLGDIFDEWSVRRKSFPRGFAKVHR